MFYELFINGLLNIVECHEFLILYKITSCLFDHFRVPGMNGTIFFSPLCIDEALRTIYSILFAYRFTSKTFSLVEMIKNSGEDFCPQRTRNYMTEQIVG